MPTETTSASISPPGLLPELRAGRAVVRLRVRVVRVLVGLEPARDLLGEPVGDGVVALRRVVLDGGRRDHDLGAVRAQGRDLLLAHLVRHHEDAAVALVRGRDREPDAGVARGRLDDRPAGTEAPVALGGLDHRDADAVLVGAAGVEELELCEQRRPRLLAERDQPDDRRAADEVEDGRVGARHTARSLVEGRRRQATRRAPTIVPCRTESDCTSTERPDCGAWIMRFRPMYMPTWPSPLKKTRSPGRSFQRLTGRPTP